VTDSWRLPPVPAADLTEEQKAAFIAGIKPEHVQHFFPVEQSDVPWPTGLASLLHHPKLAHKWLSFNYTLLYEGLLTHRQRELMVLRVGWRTRSTYEWIQHCRLAPRYDITPEDIVAISEGRYDEFEPLERDLLTATDEMIDGYRISDDTWQRLASQLDGSRLEEVTFTIAAYTALAMVFESLGVQIEPEWLDTPGPRFPEE
jgi:4-carboxymuconolactone decarboxylase